MTGFIGGYYRFAVWTMRLAYLNLCWVVFTALGFFVFGFMPATTAMFAVVRKWMRGEADTPILPTFWYAYRKDFLKTNGLGIILFLLGYVLITEFQLLHMQESWTYYAVSFIVLATLMLYVVVLTYFFPIFVHFNLRMVDYLKWPFVIGVIHPLLTVFIMAGIGVVYYVTWISIPAFLFFFGGSATACFIMWAASMTFAKYERAEA